MYCSLTALMGSVWECVSGFMTVLWLHCGINLAAISMACKYDNCMFKSVLTAVYSVPDDIYIQTVNVSVYCLSWVFFVTRISQWQRSICRNIVVYVVYSSI